MSEAVKSPSKSSEPTVPAAVLTVAGVAAAFGVASCCALPMMLYGLGIGSAGLLGIAAFAEPHRTPLLIAGAMCLLAGAALTFFYRRAATNCATDTQRPRPVARSLIGAGIFLGSILLVLGYVYV